MDLYKTSLDKKEKKFESHTNALKEANNPLVVYNSNPSINIKNLDVLDFLRILMKKLGT